MSFKRLAAIITVLFSVLFSYVVYTNAQEEITPEKRVLIKELLEITEARKMSEDIVNMILVQCEQNYHQMISQMLSEAKISEDKKDKIQNEIIGSRLRFSRRFRELFPQRIDFYEVMERIYYPLYNKYFTEAELRDLIVFYKSPTGKKSISIMPQLMQESMQKTNELLNPKIIQLINEILQEEKERLLESDKGL